MDIFAEGARKNANRPSAAPWPEDSADLAMARRQIGQINAQIPTLAQQLSARYSLYLWQQRYDAPAVAKTFPNFVEPTEMTNPVYKTRPKLTKVSNWRKHTVMNHQRVIGTSDHDLGWTIFDTMHSGGGALKLMLDTKGAVFETDGDGMIIRPYDVSQDLPPGFLFPEVTPLALEAHILKQHPLNRTLAQHRAVYSKEDPTQLVHHAQNIGGFALAFADVYRQQVVNLVANNVV